jgi:pilus assembly protein CpaC
LRQLAPGERISADSVDGNLVLTGIVSDAGKADKVRALAGAIAGEVKGSQVINRMTVATPNQVNLHVRIAEVSLTALSAIGVNWHKLGSNLIINTNNPTTISSAIGSNEIIIGRVASQAISATIDALAQEGLITDLAEPDLVALNGQTASFLAGGEFPVRQQLLYQRCPDHYGRVQELWRQPRLHPDDHRCASSRSASAARGQRFDDSRCRLGAHQH